MKPASGLGLLGTVLKMSVTALPINSFEIHSKDCHPLPFIVTMIS